MAWKRVLFCLVATPSAADFLSSVVSALGADATNGLDVASAALHAIEETLPTTVPSTFPEASSSISSIFAEATNIIDTAPSLILNGFDPNDALSIVKGFSPIDNSVHNVNLRNPSSEIYPKASGNDAPYSIPEASLRAAIFLPSTFTYGTKPPVILFPGTAVAAGMSYAYTYGRTLAKEAFADPLWVNIPKESLADAQITAEYAAYAMNYIAGITNRNVTIITFSQGSVNVQWAFKYWPSTRKVTNSFIALSPDYHGTVNAFVLCPDFPNLGCTPSILQQEYNSTFIRTLRADGGDSAYVPTTSVRSATDEIVQPQTGSGASGVLLDGRGVAASNYLVQHVCPTSPAGTVVTHEGILYNALAYALTIDVLKNGGTGQTKRIDLSAVCNMFAAEGQSLTDLIAVESTFVVFVANFLKYEPRVFKEPPIMSYAL